MLLFIYMYVGVSDPYFFLVQFGHNIGTWDWQQRMTRVCMVFENTDFCI